MRNGDKVVQMIPAAGNTMRRLPEWRRDHLQPGCGVDRRRGSTGPSTRGRCRSSGGNWDGSPCSYAKGFVEFVYRDEANAAAGDARMAPCTPDAMRLGL